MFSSGNSPVVLNGGTLDAGSFTNTLSTLSVSADSTLDLGTGELAFTSQSGAAWSGQLELTGTLGSTSLRFDPKLTTDQLSRIEYDGKSVMQNADGYIREIYGTMILIH